ncbi:hypothetical protein P170DRAFT_146077 [Aspergillus steynii IBT 23096]|uniref:Uncharacterized protein n=1 Tax=Aspergillus steynii IBT 23096 TaxID=1392250 RepID=A0A2I2GC96_9EURO|nr:uncharacterized protein P170DRAFT_146077 [Aspergillus steynii IBT 23096]PLB50500.1 hypothetical protein P170DRAFT_146077 [Aspergillus steynii IBT 23096]
MFQAQYILRKALLTNYKCMKINQLTNQLVGDGPLFCYDFLLLFLSFFLSCFFFFNARRRPNADTFPMWCRVTRQYSCQDMHARVEMLQEDKLYRR